MKPSTRSLLVLCLATVLGGCSTPSSVPPEPTPEDLLDWSDRGALERWYYSVREEFKAGRKNQAAERMMRFEQRVMTSENVPEAARAFFEEHMLGAKTAREFSSEVERLGLRGGRVVSKAGGFEVVVGERRYRPGDWPTDNMYLRSVDISADPDELTFVFKGYTFVCALDQ